MEYHDRANGTYLPVVVDGIDHSVEPVSYIVRFDDGRVRVTEADRLAPSAGVPAAERVTQPPTGQWTCMHCALYCVGWCPAQT